MPPSSTGQLRTALVTTRLDDDAHAELLARAERADRTIAAELRRAVRFYLAQPDTERAA